VRRANPTENPAMLTSLDLPLSNAAGVLPVLAPLAEVPVRREIVRRQLSSEQLFAGLTEIEIQHGDAVYRLRRTSLGKLILTK
jgi:hemin uptake protein HemP